MVHSKCSHSYRQVLLSEHLKIDFIWKFQFNFQVLEGGQVTLTFDNLEVSDPDTVLDDLIVVIEIQPGFGVIKDIAPG